MRERSQCKTVLRRIARGLWSTCITLPHSSKVGQSIQRRKLRHFLNNLPTILHDNARAHAAGAVTNLLNRWGWEVLSLLLFSRFNPPRLRSQNHFVPRGTRFRTDHDVLQVTDCSLRNIQRLGSANSIQRLPHRWEYMIHNGGGYIEGL